MDMCTAYFVFFFQHDYFLTVLCRMILLIGPFHFSDPIVNLLSDRKKIIHDLWV